MATEEQKKARLVKLFNTIVFGFARGLYDLFGDTALATADAIGEGLIGEMERELGLEIQGEDPQAILTEIERLLIDEYGLAKSLHIEIKGNEINLVCEGCAMWQATLGLKAAGIPPYTCVPMTIASSALRKRLGRKARFDQLVQDMDKQICNIDFHLLD